MKLDTNVLRYMTKDDFRVLTAVEMGQKNHEIVPSVLIESIAGLKHGGTFKCLKHLLRNKLVHHDNTKYDGYRLTYLGYDYLAIKALVNRGAIAGVGRQIGVGKESDIFEVMDEEGHVMALKLHRLGRTSFRAVKSKRDYLHKGSHFSWLYLSRLAALKEFAFMTALGEHGLPVPQAIDHNRHAVLMTLLDAYPLVQVRELSNARKVYTQLMKMLSKLAGLGLIHCDFNEFNLLINDREELTLIDFPQMVSVSHPNAQELFERDVECIVCFFSKKLGYVAERDEGLEVIRPNFQEAVAAASGSIDQQLRASGFKLEHQTVLDRFVTSKGREDSEAGSSEDEDADNWSRSEGREGPGGCRSSDVGERSGSRSSGAEHATTCAAATTDLVVAAPGAAVAGSTSSASVGEDSPWAPNGEGGPAAAAAAQSMMKGLSLGQKQQPQVAAVLGVQRRRALRRVAASSRNANKGRNLGRRGAPEGSGGG